MFGPLDGIYISHTAAQSFHDLLKKSGLRFIVVIVGLGGWRLLVVHCLIPRTRRRSTRKVGIRVLELCLSRSRRCRCLETPRRPALTLGLLRPA